MFKTEQKTMFTWSSALADNTKAKTMIRGLE